MYNKNKFYKQHIKLDKRAQTDTNKQKLIT